MIAHFVIAPFLFPFLHGEAVRLIACLVQTACDVIIVFLQVENKKVERRADDGRIEAFVAGCHADIEEYIVIPFDEIFHDRMMAVQLVDIVQERLAGRPLRAGAQMHADEKVHAVIRNDSRHDLVACAGRQRCHENHRIKRVMHILTAEEIQPFCLHILFESIRFQILMPNPCGNGVTLSAIKNLHAQ